jgi:hypothetical protein
MCLPLCQLFSYTDSGERGEFYQERLHCPPHPHPHWRAHAWLRCVCLEACQHVCVRVLTPAFKLAGGAVLGCVSGKMGPLSHVCDGGGATPQYPLHATAHYSQTHVRLFFRSPGSEGQQGARVFLTTQS